jgi:hypothetical protein
MICLLLLAVLLAPSAAVALDWQPDFETAGKIAKQNHRDLLVFFNGSDWSEPARQFQQRVLAAPDFANALKDQFVFLEIDQPENAGTAGQDLARRNQGLKCTVWNFPGVALCDENGKVYGLLTGLRDHSPAEFLPRLNPLRAAKQARDQKWALAAPAAGAEQARLLGESLTNLDEKLIHDNYADILDRIKKADPKDETGYYRRFTFDISGCTERTIDPLLQDKKTTEALAAIDQELLNPALTLEQMQKLHALRFHVFMQDHQTSRALDELREITRLNPTNDMALGAENYRKYICDPIDVPLHWQPSHTRTWWAEWHVDVSQKITGPGTYEIAFKHTDGDGLEVRDASICRADHVLATGQDIGNKSFRVTIPEGEKGGGLKLVAHTKSGGWLSGRGEIVVTRK